MVIKRGCIFDTRKPQFLLEYLFGLLLTVLVMILVFVLFWKFCPRRRYKYRRLYHSRRQVVNIEDVAYTATQGTVYIDDKYENTFIGITVPLLEKVTEI